MQDRGGGGSGGDGGRAMHSAAYLHVGTIFLSSFNIKHVNVFHDTKCDIQTTSHDGTYEAPQPLGTRPPCLWNVSGISFQRDTSSC